MGVGHTVCHITKPAITSQIILLSAASPLDLLIRSIASGEGAFLCATRTLGARWAPRLLVGGFLPFGHLNFALWALRPCDL